MRDKLARVVAAFAARPRDSVVPPWILPPASCEFLAEVARLLPPSSTAFEFGSGRSTHVLRRVCAGLTSIEDSVDWLEQTEKLEGAVPKRSADFTSVIPLRKKWNRLRLIESFDVSVHPEILRQLRRARLVLVDSPPNPAKREHALYLALRHTPASAVIIVDDLEVRATDRFTTRLAKQNANAFHFWRVDIDHQVGIFLKLRAGAGIHSRPTPREFIGTWLRA